MGLRPAGVLDWPGTVDQNLPLENGGFATFGEQLAAIRDETLRGLSGGMRDPRLYELRATAAGGSEAVPADGGFLVAPEFSRQLVHRVYLVGQILRRCTELPITAPRANAIRFPQFSEVSRANGSRLGGVQGYWANEADQATKSKPKFEISELVAEKLIGLVYLTNELLVDSGAMDAWANWAFSHELNFKFEDAIVSGSGVGTPLGLLNSNALITVPAEAGQGSGTVISQNVIKMIARLWPPSRANTAWLYNPELLPQLSQLTVSVGGGGSISNLWQFAAGEGEFDSLCGLPAIPSEYCMTVGTPGDLILADFSRYVTAVREGIQGSTSIHVSFLTDESAFRFVMRANGMPVDKLPITPKNGTNTLSSFIALAAR